MKSIMVKMYCKKCKIEVFPKDVDVRMFMITDLCDKCRCITDEVSADVTKPVCFSAQNGDSTKCVIPCITDCDKQCPYYKCSLPYPM